jgi:hypothetical protein
MFLNRHSNIAIREALVLMMVNNCSCRATTGKEAVPMCRILEAIMDYDGDAADTPDCLEAVLVVTTSWPFPLGEFAHQWLIEKLNGDYDVLVR